MHGSGITNEHVDALLVLIATDEAFHKPYLCRFLLLNTIEKCDLCRAGSRAQRPGTWRQAQHDPTTKQ
ncbi:hypothetical protein LMH87_005364 [Akanthomyces muscarius]|uniref:Uncharacterized protein n=1 Tax=Akanthomyces muscarius TaxID=2231603 RepID=A0A9W8QP13_AKAMU|nr:hypothetical protein LMH87_005364 [Akanthomyces muscarius]KAJ4163652.1 hypothetical protein LMH87_005364 [Akanthomyces muscarius]